VAEVLQSAEAMKLAVSHLEQFMEGEDTADRGSVLLATVKGDVHDIGKNLVDIILSNNGYRVVNLGIKVPPEALITAFREHRPDAIGLSGLLVKSAQQMVVTAEDLRAAGVDVPILVGGAALSERFTRTRIAPAYDHGVLYCSDAMAGLDTLNRLQDAATRDETLARARPEAATPPSERPRPAPTAPAARSSRISTAPPPLPPPAADRQVLDPVPDLADVWRYLNPQMLYGKHLGLKGSFRKLVEAGDPKALELERFVTELQAEARRWMRVTAVWRFYEATSEGNRIDLSEPGRAEIAWSFELPRQPKDDGLCLADLVLPPAGAVRDSVAVFVVGAGEGIRERAELAKSNGEYLRSHALQALALETAEAAAEWLHARLRADWGFPDPPETTMKDRFAARYRGKRYSFGYPACPDLDDQVGIWKLLRPEEIGVHLTDGMMMEPEASVSALVFHHPDATYFAAGGVER